MSLLPTTTTTTTILKGDYKFSREPSIISFSPPFALELDIVVVGLFAARTLISPHSLTLSPDSHHPGVGHKMKAPVRPLRGPWDKYSLQEVEETKSTKPQESSGGDEARFGQVAHTPSPPKTGGT